MKSEPMITVDPGAHDTVTVIAGEWSLAFNASSGSIVIPSPVGPDQILVPTDLKPLMASETLTRSRALVARAVFGVGAKVHPSLRMAQRSSATANANASVSPEVIEVRGETVVRLDDHRSMLDDAAQTGKGVIVRFL
jgi:hypothetical protein